MCWVRTYHRQDAVPVTTPTILNRVQKNPGFLNSPTHLVLGFYWVLGFSDYFIFNEQLGSLLVDLAHQLSFYLDLPVLQII